MLKKTLPLLLTLMFLAGCAAHAETPVFGGAPGDPFSKTTVLLCEFALPSDDKNTAQRLADPNRPEGAYLLERLNQIVRDNGFQIEFKSVPMGPHNSLLEQRLEQEQQPYYSYQYQTTMIDFLDSLAGGDVVMVYPPGRKDLAGFYNALFARRNELTREISPELWLDAAPGFYELYEAYLCENPFFVPTGYDAPPLDRPVVLLPDGIADEYGEDIGTLEDYLSFIEWAGARHPELTASGVSMGTAFSNYIKYMFNLPLTGLIEENLSGILVDPLIYFSAGIEMTVEGGKIGFLPVERDPAFRDAVKRLLALKDAGQIAFFDLSHALSGYDGYASMVIGTQYYWDNLFNAMKSKTPSLKQFYSYMQQTPFILGEGEIPALRRVNSGNPQTVSVVGVHASDQAVSEWLSFLEWIHSNSENSRMLLWGQKDVEYTLVDGIYQPLPCPDKDLFTRTPYDFRFDFHALKFFADARFAGVTARSIDTSRYLPELDGYIQAQRDLDERTQAHLPEIAAMIRAFSGNADRDGAKADFLFEREQAYIKFLSDLIALPANQADDLIDQFESAQREAADRVIAYIRATAGL